MTMSKKDFERIALAIRKARCAVSDATMDSPLQREIMDNAVDMVVLYLLPVLRDSNPRFDDAVFVKATLNPEKAK